MKRPREVIVGVTGSIASYKACDVIALLRTRDLKVTPVLTREAHHFITPLTLETLACSKVFSDMFEVPTEWEPLHVSLADRADAVVIVPATANVIGKLASGICDDLLTCVVFATKAPVVIAPAMNDRMYMHSIVQENIARLKAAGFTFVGPVKGRLACGREGIGHLAPVEAIVSAVTRLLT